MVFVILVSLAAGVVVYITARLYFSSHFGVCHSSRDLVGKTVIVTGANTGIGFETARDLANRYAKVIIACRDMKKGEKAAKEIINITGNRKVTAKKLDLSSFKSIRSFAEDILNTEDRLDILVNNAGVMFLPWKSKTVDGFETIMATNHYGHFLLTNLLLQLLKKSSPARVVIVSSLVHEFVRMDLKNLNGEKFFIMIHAYGMSKLANVLVMRELSRRLEGTGVTVNALHPGVINTELERDMNRVLYYLMKLIVWPIRKNAKEGAQTSIYVAVSEELEGVSGKYFSDCKERKLWKHARDPEVAKRLWQHSEDVTGLKATE